MTIKQIWDNWIVRNLILAVAAVLVFVTLVSIFLSLGTQHGREIEVPDFTNLTWSEARKVASDRGVRVILADSVYVKRLKPGVVYL